MADNADKKMGKTNGETDGDDAEIYGTAAAVSAFQLAVASSAAVGRFHEIVEVRKDAVGLLQTLGQTTEISDCSDRLVGALGEVAKEGLRQTGRLLPLLREVLPLLSGSDVPEVRACSEKIEAIVKRSGDSPSKALGES